MKKENINFIILWILVLLSCWQFYQYNYSSAKLRNINIISIVNKEVEHADELKVIDIINTLSFENINIINIVKQEEIWRATLNFEGKAEALLNYINILDKLNINVENYKLDKDNNMNCYLDVIFP